MNSYPEDVKIVSVPNVQDRYPEGGQYLTGQKDQQIDPDSQTSKGQDMMGDSAMLGSLGQGPTMDMQETQHTQEIDPNIKIMTNNVVTSTVPE